MRPHRTLRTPTMSLGIVLSVEAQGGRVGIDTVTTSVVVSGAVSVEQSLGGHSVGTGQVGQVTVGQEVGGGVVGQVGQVTRGRHVGQMVGGAQVGHGSRVGHVPQQLLQVGQEGVDGVLGSETWITLE
jgi:hypothetical protein